MKIDERRREVLEYLKSAKDEIVSISDIAEEVRASIRTVKNDLNFLVEICPIKILRGIGGGVQFSNEKIFDRLISIISFDREKDIAYCRLAFRDGFIPICFQLYFSAIFGDVPIIEEDVLDFEYYIIKISHEIWVLGNDNKISKLLCYAEKSLKSIKYFIGNVEDNDN